jgi:hypothetical protein
MIRLTGNQGCRSSKDVKKVGFQDTHLTPTNGFELRSFAEK